VTLEDFGMLKAPTISLAGVGAQIGQFVVDHAERAE
jgi:hypothetical protein